MFHEGFGERDGVCGLELDNVGKAGKVAHGSEDVLGAAISDDSAWLPDIDVNDGKRGRDGPRVDEFAVSTNASVGEDAVGARADPRFDVGTELVPVEAEADAVKSLVGH